MNSHRRLFLLLITICFITNTYATDLLPRNVIFNPPSGDSFIGSEVYVSFEIYNNNVVTAFANEWIAGVRVLDPFGTQIYSETVNGVDLNPFQAAGFSMALPFIPQVAGTYSVTVYNQYAFEVNPGNDNLQQSYFVNQAPENIFIIFPENGATDIPISPPPTIEWTNGGPPISETSVFFGPTISSVDPNTATPLTNTINPITQFTPPGPLTSETDYYWAVRQENPSGITDNGPFLFTTETVDDPCPPPLSVLMPSDGTQNYPFAPTIIEVDQISDQSSPPILIELYLGTTPESVDPSQSVPFTSTTNIENTTFIFDDPLLPNTDYYVRTALICEENQILGNINQFTTAPAASLAGQTAKVYGGTSTEVIPIELVQLNLSGTVTFPNTDIYEIQKDISSGEDGNYIFQSLPPGDYQLNVTPPENWMIQSPSESFFDIFVEVGANITELDFLLIPPPSEITGEKWLDENQDGNKDEGEDKIPNWPINLTGNSYAGSTLNLSTNTGSSGMYSFAEVPPGNYTISEGIVEGWIQTYPSGIVHEIQVDDGNPVNDLDFGNYPTSSSISGRKFFDDNKNGTLDPNELGINNWVIQLFSGSGQLLAEQKTYAIDLDGSGNLDPRLEFGWFLFNGLAPGNYIVREVQKEGWEVTVPINNEYSVSLSAGQNINSLNFGNHFGFLDWGDLPEPADSLFGACPPGDQCYPTLPPLGARHAAVGAKLGQLRDTEPSGIPSDFANGDDTTGVDDEDGVEFLKFLPGISGEVEVTITGDPDDFPTFLAAWIDFNGNGQFEPFEGELIIDEEIFAEGTYHYTFPVPDLIEGPGYARFRIGTDLQTLFGPVWFGISQDGEVEDYVGLGFDYGDANRIIDNEYPYFPHGYPVMLVDDGARHIATPTTLLGSVLTDSENDGQPDIFASGDDINDRDDEDGILLIDGYQIVYSGPNPKVPNKNLIVHGFTQGTDVSFKPLATRTGFLNLWIDFNGDGDWDDLNEHVFDDEPIISGPDYTLLTFTVPEDAKIGWSYARFRYSTQTNLKVTGPAKDGEVEDYLIAILPPIDFGDAPEPYPTLFADNGAFHMLSQWYLGELIDAELDGLPHPDALGDDSDNLDDEDGIIFLDELTSGAQASIEVKSNVPVGHSGYLSAWVDFDQNGSWESLEQVIIDVELFGGLDTLTISIPTNASPGETFMRFRFSNQTGLGPTETFLFPAEINIKPGEVEDYKITIDSLITSIKNDLDYVPQEFNLYQNYPNPFNPSTIIRYDVKEPSYVRLDVYNILGQLVTTLVNQVQTAGAYEAVFKTNNLSAGIYFYSIRMSNYTKTMKMILMK